MVLIHGLFPFHPGDVLGIASNRSLGYVVFLAAIVFVLSFHHIVRLVIRLVDYLDERKRRKKESADQGNRSH